MTDAVGRLITDPPDPDSGHWFKIILSGTDLGELWRIAEGLQLPFDLVGAGLDGHARHVEAEGEQALLTLKHNTLLAKA
jgi:hypothetical protein